MTHWEFSYYLSALTHVFVKLTDYFSDIFSSCFTAFLFWASSLTIYFFVKFIIVPLVGRSMGSGRSDSVRKTKKDV